MAHNQFTKADELGAEKPKGANQFTSKKRDKLDQATVDKIRAERAAQCAEQIMNDDASSKTEKLAAAKLLLPFGKSTLQSIESREVNEWEAMSEEELKTLVRALITSHPELLREFAPGPQGAISTEAPQQMGEQAPNDTAKAA